PRKPDSNSLLRYSARIRRRSDGGVTRASGHRARCRTSFVVLACTALIACGTADRGRPGTSSMDDDPLASAGTAQTQPTGSSPANAQTDAIAEPELAAWAQRNGARDAGSMLQAISVYGRNGSARSADERGIRV